MGKISLRPTAKLLKWTVLVMLILNIAATLSLPIWLSWLYKNGQTILLTGGYFYKETAHVRSDFNLMLGFLGVCSLMSLAMLLLAYRILVRMCKAELFCMKNAKDLKLMALCCIFIVLAGIFKAISLITLYNLLFIGVFCLGALFLLVLSEVFTQASKLKEDNDLVI